MTTTGRKHFKPFDKVLVKPTDSSEWCCRFYDHFDSDEYYHLTTDGTFHYDENIISFEGNKYLVGTRDKPEKDIKLMVGEKLVCSNLLVNLQNGTGYLGGFEKTTSEYFKISNKYDTLYKYALRYDDFDPNDIEETTRHILCIKGGKIVRYKD